MNRRMLNFGCGSIQPEGWDNLDKDPSFGTIFQDINLISSNHYDIIVAHCSLQMIEWHDLVAELKQLYRILAPGGVLRISLPDIEAGFNAIRNGDISWFPNAEPDIDDRFCAWITWYSTTKTLLTENGAKNKLIEAGFREIQITAFKKSWFASGGHSPICELDTRQDECFFIEAKK